MLKKIFILFIILFIPITVFSKESPYIAMDIDSGRILASNDMYNRQLIASITKIMTCILVLENMDINKEVVVGNEVLEMYGTNIYIEVGEKIRIIDLLYGLMLRSGNDAAVTLAVNTFGSEENFVMEMNNKAKLLGMKDTSFSNCHGLDDNSKNYSTAYDMALLSRYAFNNEMYRKIISTNHYQTKSSLKSYDWYNRVSILNSYKYSLGGKNGYTPAAGKTLVSYASKDDLTIVVVSLSDSDSYNHHENIFSDLFKKYKNYLIIDKDSFYIDKSLIPMREIYINKSFYYPLKESEINSIKTLIKLNTNNSNGVGEIELFLNNKSIGKIPIKERKKEEKKSSLLDKIKSLIGGKS